MFFIFYQEEKEFEEKAAAEAERYKKELDKLKRLREKFNDWDTDGNQVIDQKEFRKLAQEVFECGDLEAIALFKQVDVNGSGSISLQNLIVGWKKK